MYAAVEVEFGLSVKMRRTVRLLLQNRLHDEVTMYLHAERYERRPNRRGVRNGVHRRCIVTTWGTIPDLEMPCCRRPGFTSTVIPRYQHRKAAVDQLVQAVFLAGVSTRRIGPTLAQLLGNTVSPSTVSRIIQTLDQAVTTWHQRLLHDEHRYLVLDGLTLRVKTPDGTKRRFVLVAYAVTPVGWRHVID